MSKKVSIFRQDPWQKRHDETPKEYEMFEIYRESSPVERDGILVALSANFRKTPDEIEEIAGRNQWLSRAVRYDTWKISSRKQVAMMSRDEAGSKMVGLSRQVIELAKKSLEWLDANDKHPSYREAVEMIRVSIELNKNGLVLQGISPGTDLMYDSSGSSPRDLIEAASQVNRILFKRVDTVEITQDDRVEPEVIEN